MKHITSVTIAKAQTTTTQPGTDEIISAFSGIFALVTTLVSRKTNTTGLNWGL